MSHLEAGSQPGRPDGSLSRPAPQGAIPGWLGATAPLFVFSILVPMKMIVFETSGPGESGRMDEILYDDFELPAEESVLVQSESSRRARRSSRQCCRTWWTLSAGSTRSPE